MPQSSGRGNFSTRLRGARRWARRTLALVTGDYSRLLGARVGEEVAGQIRAAQLAGLMRSSGLMMGANIFNGAILVAALWTSPSRNLALAWAAVALTMACMFVWRGARPSRRMDPRHVSARSMRKAMRNGAILGLLWGAAPVLFFSGAPYEARLIIICLCAGMLGGGAFVLASIPAAAIAMIAPVAFGSIWGLWVSDHADSGLVTLLLVAYCSVLIQGSLAHAMDVVSRLVSKIDIERLSLRDGVTDLLNHVALRDALATASLRFQRASEACTLFCINIDQFRDINDRYGYAVGDDLLIEVAARLRSAIRDIDVPARIAGDQFAVLAPGLGGEATARAYANRLIATFEAPFKLKGGEVSIFASVGAAIARPGAGDPEALLRNADTALHRAKRQGHGVASVFSPDEDAERMSRDALESELRAALAAGDLRLNYQPFLDIGGDRIVGFEALLRWTHPIRGPIPAPEIISIAEERGLMEAVGLWVLREACRAASEWPDGMRVAVNISARQLRNRALTGHVMSALATAGLERERLELEVTETVLVDDEALARDILRSISGSGVRLALDDFGVGYSSLNYLRRLPFDRIKIDRSFMAEALVAPDSAAIVHAVIELARNLRMEVTAEGVETVEQLAFLHEHQCSEAQGWLIGKPMAEAKISSFLRAWKAHAAA